MPKSDDPPSFERSELLHFSYDWNDVPPASAVVEAVAMSHGKDLTDFEPLYETVDPDALNQLIHSLQVVGDSLGSISFSYADREVTLDIDGTVVVSNRT